MILSLFLLVVVVALAMKGKYSIGGYPVADLQTPNQCCCNQKEKEKKKKE